MKGTRKSCSPLSFQHLFMSAVRKILNSWAKAYNTNKEMWEAFGCFTEKSLSS